MMIEIIDNSIQLILVLFCSVWAGHLAVKKRSRTFFILACFYVSLFLGLLYWFIYLVLMTYSPKFFYVSDLTWCASFLFLLTLESDLQSPGARYMNFRGAWAATVPGALLILYYLYYGYFDLIGHLSIIILMICAFRAVKSLLYLKTVNQLVPEKKQFYLLLLGYIHLEFLLWFISYAIIWTDSLKNPYFWCDSLVTVLLLFLVPATERAVNS